MRNYPFGPKLDWRHQAEQIAAGEIVISDSGLPMLLEWLMDMNWPGAIIIAEHLPTYGLRLGLYLKPVFESGDDIWIQGVLAVLSEKFDGRFWLPYLSELRRIAHGMDREGADAEALCILARYGLDSAERIQAVVREAENLPGADPRDFQRVKLLLKP